MIHAYLLGEFRLEVNGRIISQFPSHKVASLLAYLLCHTQKHARSHLIQLFWGNKPLESARNNLRVSLSLIRRVVEPAGVPAGSVLQCTRAWVRMVPEAFTTDVAIFEETYRKAVQCTDPIEQSQMLEQVCELYGGDFLSDWDEAWVRAMRDRYRQMYEDTLRRQRSKTVEALPMAPPRAEGLGVLLGILSDPPDPRLPGWTRAIATTQKGFLFTADTHGARLFFNSLERALKALNSLQAQIASCRFAVDIGEVKTPAVGGGKELWATVDAMLQLGTAQQILCTERMAALMSHERYLRNYTFQRIGYFQLPSGKSELLFQMNYLGQSQPFPPVKATPALAKVLTEVPTKFIGREEELSSLHELFCEQHARVITIVGPPGVGKSRLALEYAHRAEAFFGEARWWIQFFPGMSIGETLARRLGWEWYNESHFVNRICGLLENQPALLVIDGLDQGAEQSKEEITRLLQAIPSLHCLITALFTLNLPTEYVYPLKPLPVPQDDRKDWKELASYAGVQLFIDRTQQITPQFCLTEENASEVARLCRWLDGLPIAIEMAAAHSGGSDLKVLLRRLQSSSRWLRERPYGMLSRSLYASLETVYQSLSPDLRRFWARLSCFRGGFTPEAALSVATPPTEVLEALAFLERRSLVQVQDGRYSLLEPLRLFAELRLKDHDSQERTALNHCRYYLKLATVLGNHPSRWNELEHERGNLQAAIEWSATHEPDLSLSLAEALATFWERRGCDQPVYNTLLHLVDRLSTPPACLRAAQIVLNLAVRRGDTEHAQMITERFLPIADNMPDTEITAVRFWITAGFRAWMAGEYETSVQLLAQAVKRANTLEAVPEEANALIHLGTAHWTRGALSEALETLTRAYSLLQTRELPILRLKAISNLANVLHQMGRMEEAEHYLNEALHLAHYLSDPRTIATLYNNWAVWLCERGEIERARTLCLEAMSIWQQLNEVTGETASLFNLADIAFLAGDYETASLLFHRSMEQILRYHLHWYLPSTLQRLSMFARTQHQAEQALYWNRLWLYTALLYGGPEQVAQALLSLAELMEDQNAPQQAAFWGLLVQPLTHYTPPMALLRRLKSQIPPSEWKTLQRQARLSTCEQIMSEIQPLYEEFLSQHH